MLTKWEKQYIESHIDQIDELIADADPLFLDGVISEEYGKDHYDKWKNHERKKSARHWHNTVTILKFSSMTKNHISAKL